jgi:hypothetical protein
VVQSSRPAPPEHKKKASVSGPQKSFLTNQRETLKVLLSSEKPVELKKHGLLEITSRMPTFWGPPPVATVNEEPSPFSTVNSAVALPVSLHENG